jgi:hypothetical protein
MATWRRSMVALAAVSVEAAAVPMAALSGLVEVMASVAAMATWRRFMVALAAVSVAAASAVYDGFVRIG